MISRRSSILSLRRPGRRFDRDRAVIFETNEHSWHGFRRIQLPEDRLHLSRKCLSIYLYTADRPAHEIAGPHGTFYVQWPFPDKFAPGRILSAGDVEELRDAYTHRDRQIEMYQHMEERLGREMEGLRRYLGEVLAAIRAPVVGYGQQVGDSLGLFHDGWVGRDVSLRLRTDREVTSVTIKGVVPEHFPQLRRAFEIAIDGERFTFLLQTNGSFDFSCPTEIAAGTTFRLTLRCDSEFNASATGKGGDQRNLSYHLDAIELSHEPG